MFHCSHVIPQAKVDLYKNHRLKVTSSFCCFFHVGLCVYELVRLVKQFGITAALPSGKIQQSSRQEEGVTLSVPQLLNNNLQSE